MKKYIPAIIPVASIIASIYWIVMGFTKYGFWVRRGPGGGFLPIIGGIIVLVFSILLLLSHRKNKDDKVEFSWLAFLAPAGLLALVLCSYLLGMIISMALYIFLWLFICEKYKWTKSALISFCTVAIIYAIFIVWLSVPMPKGVLGLL